MLSKYTFLIYLQHAKFFLVAAIFIKHFPSWRGRAKTSTDHHSTGHLSTRLQLIQPRSSWLCMVALSQATFLTALTSLLPQHLPLYPFSYPGCLVPFAGSIWKHNGLLRSSESTCLIPLGNKKLGNWTKRKKIIISKNIALVCYDQVLWYWNGCNKTTSAACKAIRTVKNTRERKRMIVTEVLKQIPIQERKKHGLTFYFKSIKQKGDDQHE